MAAKQKNVFGYVFSADNLTNTDLVIRFLMN